MEHAPPDCQYGHKEIAAFTDLSAVGPDPLDELAGTHHADGRRSALGSSVNVARLDHRKKRAAHDGAHSGRADQQVPFEARAVVEDRRRSVATRHDGRDVSPRVEIPHRKGIAQQVVEQGPRGGVLVAVVRR